MPRRKSEKVQRLLESKSVQYWLEGLDQRTKKNYLESLPKFISYIKMNPDDMIAQRKEDLKSEDKNTQRKWEHTVKTWYREQYDVAIQEGKSTWTPFSHLRTVLSFFSRNDMPLKFKRKDLPYPTKKAKRTGLRIEDIKTLYENVESLRDKALLLTLLQSGLSEIDLCKLNISDVPMEKLKEGLVYLEGYREKTKEPYQTCIGSDACICIERMLKAKVNFEPNEPLFLSVHGERMQPRFINESLQPIAQRIGLKEFKVKALRDLFHDALLRSRLSADVKDRMMGHMVSGARKHYEISPTTIIESYQTAYQYLTINHTTHQREFNWQKINELRVEDFRIIMGYYKGRFPEEFNKDLQKFVPERAKTENRDEIRERLKHQISDFDMTSPLPSQAIEKIAFYRMLSEE